MNLATILVCLVLAALIALVVAYFVLRNKGKINLSFRKKNKAARE